MRLIKSVANMICMASFAMPVATLDGYASSIFPHYFGRALSCAMLVSILIILIRCV